MSKGPERRIAREDGLHASVPRFFAHHQGLAILKAKARACALCRAIWDQYTIRTHPMEMTPESLTKGTGLAQIYIGITMWNNKLNSLPHIVATQYGLRGEERQLAWFEHAWMKRKLFSRISTWWPGRPVKILDPIKPWDSPWSG